MTPPLRILPVIFALLLSACAKDPAQEALSLTVDNAILPLYQQFTGATEKLLADNEQYCKRPDTDGLTIIQNQWRETMSSWQSAQVIAFGPIAEDNQAWHLQFWPDKKNLTARKVEALLDSEQAIDTTALKKAGVIVQGLTAMEYLLFDPASNTVEQLAQTRRCQLLVEQARQIHSVANRVFDSWRSGYARQFSNPGEDNPEFKDSASALGALVDALVLEAELVGRRKLEEPLGLSGRVKIPQPYAAESWRSGHSLANIAANLQGIETVFNAGLAQYLHEKGEAALVQNIQAQLTTATGLLTALKQPLFEAVHNEEQHQALTALHSEIVRLIALLKRELPPAIGVTLGFNSNDGD